jgi:uncharacterized protein YndB with AHSA1/START domain
MTSLPDASDATLVVSRIVHRDAASLFEMWTTPAHLVRWRVDRMPAAGKAALTASPATPRLAKHAR